jgi:hypothetical protein
MAQFRKDIQVAMTGTSPAPTPEPAQPTAADDETIWKFLKGKGLNDFAIAGLMGNLFAESALRANNLQNSYEKSLGLNDLEYTKQVDNGEYTNFIKDSAGYGLAQWTFWSRKQALLDFVKAAGASIGDLNTQLNFLWKELQGYKGVMTALNGAKSILEASNAVLLEYERPADQGTAVQTKRAGYGQTYYDKFKSPSDAPTSPTQPVSPSVGVKVGDVVQFTGGAVYASSNAAIPAHSRAASRCKVTQTYNGKHPYHLISEDGKDVWGWVDAIDVQTGGGKTIDEIAREVIAGKWGNGQERKDRLKAAGYDAAAVQKRVNELLA